LKIDGRLPPKRGNCQMSKDSVKPRVKIVRPRIPKFCICPFCKTKQRFKKIKNRNLNHLARDKKGYNQKKAGNNISPKKII